MSIPSVPLCWWCGAVANSREHKFKKTDVVQTSKTWKHDDKPYYFTLDGSMKQIQGPDSKLVKFDKVMCEICNTTRSQPFDLAYDTFTAWVRGRGETLMAEDELDFVAIYGPRPEESVRNLLKYFAKHLACRAASLKAMIPLEYVAMLDGNDLPGFDLTLSRNSTGSVVPFRAGLHLFPLLGIYSPSTRKIKPPYQYGCTVGYLDVIYRYRATNGFAWEGEFVDPTRRTVKLGLYVEGDPHPGHEQQLYGFGGDRTVEIGGYAFEVPVLSPEQIDNVIAVGFPTASMSFEESLDAKVKAVHAALSPFYSDITLEFLEENLTMDAANAVWRLASGQTA